MIKINFRKIVGEYSLNFPAHDSTTPWYEWNIYTECCWSLNPPGHPSLQRFMRYQNYLKEINLK